MFHSEPEFQAAIGEPALRRGKRLACRVLSRMPGGLRDVRTALIKRRYSEALEFFRRQLEVRIASVR